MTTSTTIPEPATTDESPHVCNNGWVSMEVEVLNPGTGEETFEEALYLCRKCAERS